MSFRDTARFSGKVILAWIAAVVFVLLMAFIVMIATGVFKKETADFRGDVKATEQVQADGRYRIQAYDKFFNDCASIQSKTQQIKQAEEDLALASGDPAAERDARTTLRALRNQRTEAINQYNIDARKAGTLGQFRDSALPYSISADAETVSCGN